MTAQTRPTRVERTANNYRNACQAQADACLAFIAADKARDEATAQLIAAGHTVTITERAYLKAGRR